MPRRHHPPYRAQYADRDRIGEFLDDPAQLTTDARREVFGFATADEYADWAPRLCGIACLQMVLTHHGLANDLTTAHLARSATAHGAYVPGAGWAYAPLVDYARTLGLDGAVRAPYDLAEIQADLAAGWHPIVSVHPRVMRGELLAPPAGEGGGHLVLIVDADAGAVTIHNPNARTRATQEAYAAPIGQFKAAFAGRGLVLRRD